VNDCSYTYAYVDVNSRLYAYDVQSGRALWHTGLF
jgi:hypothetical protein